MTKRPTQDLAISSASSPAMAALEKRVQRNPDDFAATFDLATLHLRGGASEKALRFAKNCVRLAPERAQAHGVAARAFLASARHAEAAEHFRRAVDLGDATLETTAFLAKSLNEDGRPQAAARVAAEARRTFGDDERLTTAALQAALAERDRDASSALADHVLANAADATPDALAQAARARLVFDGPPAALDALDAFGARLDDHPPLLFLKGQALERLERFDAAFDAYAAANRRVRDGDGRTYRREEAARLLDAVARFFTAERLRSLPRAAPRSDAAQPVFVCGFPRSGTTLMEAILASHPSVAPGGELPILPRLRRRAPEILGSPLHYPEALSELWLADKRTGVATLRDAYLNEAAARGLEVFGDGAAAWFTDKLPLNEVNLGLIALLFPASPVILMRRDVRDVAVSCFATYLTHGFDCAFALETTVEHYRRVERTAEALRSAVAKLSAPLQLFEVGYEAFVDAPDAAVDGVFQALGLETPATWRDFHRSSRTPNTPSAAQVAQPLNRSGVGRWRRFEARLGGIDWSA